MDGTGRKRVVVTDSDRTLMNKVISGDWSVDDLIESSLDETSVSGNVGTGPDTAIGAITPVAPFKDNKLERLFKEFEEYLSRTRKPATKKEVFEFTERRALPESVERKFIAWIKEKNK